MCGKFLRVHLHFNCSARQKISNFNFGGANLKKWTLPIRLVYFQSNVISVTGVIGEVNVYDKHNVKRQLTNDQESIILKHRVNVSHIGAGQEGES